jgi:hypothetical protein
MALELREKRLLMIPVALAAILGFYNYVHVPIFSKRAEAAGRLEKVTADLKRDQNRLAGEGNLVAREEAVQAKERVIDAWVPGKNSATLFIWYLSQAEGHSGAHITGLTVGERKLVTPASQQAGAQPGAQPGEQGANGTAPQPGAQQDAQPGAQPGSIAPTVAVVQISLKVNARFPQHLLFNQALEEMPLFLSADAVSLDKADSSVGNQVGKLVASGNTWLAGQLLGASPDLNGAYQVNLYFKQDKAGPTTDPMQFSADAGRNDPFAMQGVDEFLQALVDHYKAAQAASLTAGNPVPTGASGATLTVTPNPSGELHSRK